MALTKRGHCVVAEAQASLSAIWFGVSAPMSFAEGGPVSIRRRSAYALVIAGSLALAGGLSATLFLGSSKPANQKTYVATAFSTAQEVRLERGLTARAIAEQAEVLAPVVRREFVGIGKPLLPAGSKVRFELSTFDERSSRTATVDAVVTGPKAGRWQVLLVSESSRWFVIGTRRLP
jgi:hypothetical protein